MTPEQILLSTIEPMARAIDNYGQGNIAFEAGNLKNKRDLAQLAEYNKGQQTLSKQAHKQRMKEVEEAERLRTISALRAQGVKVSDKDSMETAMEKLRDFKTTHAENILKHFDNELTRNRKEQQQTIEAIRKIATKSANPEINRHALLQTLADPAASQHLSEEQKKKLQNILLTGKDPDAAVQKVYDQIAQDYFVRKGAAASRAGSFFSKYLSEVNAKLDEDRKIDASVMMNRLNDLNREGVEVVKARDKHVTEWAGFLPKEALETTLETEPVVPQDPNDALKDVAPDQGAGGEGTETTAIPTDTTTPPAPRVGERPFTGDTTGLASTAVPPPSENVAAMQKAMSGFGAAMNPTSGMGRPGVGLAADLSTIAGDAISDPRRELAPSKAEVVSSRIQADLRGNPKPTLMPATPEEQRQVEILARNLGMDDARMSKAKALMDAGDPNAIATANRLLLLVRRANAAQGAPPPPPTQ